MPLHVPTKVEISNNDWVTITLIDANHCPGSVMYAVVTNRLGLCAKRVSRFLIQGSKGDILHTGDFRAEPTFIGRIMKNPFLKHYVARDSSQTEDCLSRKYSKTLEAIFLDTASMLNMVNIPSKV